jgi:hypothetical protein
MNNEIKEMLECLKTVNDNGCVWPLYEKEASILLDYITNLQQRINKAIEYLDFMIKHYKEQLDTPIDDTYFINDDLRRAYILSIKAYLQVLLDILKGSDKE